MRSWHRFITPILGYFRLRRGNEIRRLFPDLHAYRVLDLGGSVHFWHESGLVDHIKSVDIYNVSNSEIRTTHAISEKFRVHIYDGQRLPEPDQSYDFVISNSVLEHIPPPERAQVARVLPFIHWLPRSLGRWCVRLSPWALLSSHPAAVQDAYWAEVQLLSRSQLAALFPGDNVSSERFLALPKAWIVSW